MIRNKCKLRDIARRHAKGILLATDTSNFIDSGLTDEEIEYVSAFVNKIGESITGKDDLIDNTGLDKKFKL